MTVVSKRLRTTHSPAARLREWIARLPLPQQRLARAVRAAVRRRFPTANELAYDYKTSVVLSYSPTRRGIDGIVAIAARPDGVFLYLSQGPKLPDPHRLLRGSGKATRFVALASARQLAHPHVKALLTTAAKLAPTPLPAKGKGELVDMSAARTKRAKPKRSKAKAKPAPARRATGRAKPATARAR